MNNYPKISIVTINFNNGKYLEETILSVLQQHYPNLEYIIIDGGSTDNSVEIIKRYEKHLSYWVSEKDQGQYHAVQKGFDKSTGDIMAWISSDDLYVPNAFFAVAEIFHTFPDILWLMGIPREYTQQGSMISRITLPWGRWSKTRYYTYDFQFIQQESTFWKRALWDMAGACLNKDYKFAGDMELWLRFFRHAALYTTTATLAGFRHHHANQRSVAFRQDYLLECQQAIRNELQSFSMVNRWRYQMLRIAGFFTGPFFFYDIPVLRLFFSSLFRIPKPINYDFTQNKYSQRNQMVKLPPLFLNNKQIHTKMFKELNPENQSRG